MIKQHSPRLLPTVLFLNPVGGGVLSFILVSHLIITRIVN